jgi:RNA polymerase sigma-70 factor (ECF subfamily)
MIMGTDAESQTGTTLRVLLRDPTDPQAWKAFVERYAPRVLAWCRQWNLQPADAQDVTEEVLHKLVGQLRRFPYDPAKGRFRGWLKGVARHAWSDLRESRRRAGWGSGDPHVQQLLEEQPDRDGLLEALDQEFLHDLYEEAKARVQLRVTRSTWRAFELLVQESWPGARVAAELHLTVAAVYMAKHRVQKLLAAEVRALQGPGPGEKEGQP